MGRTGYEPRLMRELVKEGTVRRRVVGEDVGEIRVLGTVGGVAEELRISSISAGADGRQGRPKTRMTTAEEYQGRTAYLKGFYRAEKPHEVGEAAGAETKGLRGSIRSVRQFQNGTGRVG